MYYGVNFDASPQCSMFGRYRQSHGWEHNGRSLDCDLLIFVISGRATFHIMKDAYNVTPGDWLIIPRGSFYSANAPDFCEYYFFHFDSICMQTEELPFSDYKQSQEYSTRLAGKTSTTVFLTSLVASGDDFATLMTISSKMHQLMLHTGVAERLLVDQYFGQIVLLLAIRVSNSVNTSTPSTLRSAITYIQENYTFPISLNNLALELQVSKSYLLRIFRKHLGMTVMDYINGVKLDYAAQLLRTSNMNISQISDYLGYSDSGYFSRLFRRRFNTSPSSFSKKGLGT